MSLYGALLTAFPPVVAGIITALSYAVILCMIVLFLPVSPAEFRYGNY
jgi:cytochrome bd-type quinol oxidase subunit 2